MSTPASRSPKRQRQKEGRQARRAAQIAAQRRQQRNRRIVRFGIVAVILIAALVAVQAFSGDDGDDEVATDETTDTTEATTETTAADGAGAAPLTCEGPSGENTDMATKPTVEVPEEPATELTCQDLVVGDGEEVTSPTATVKVHYVGVGQQTKEEFDASWGGEPAEFALDGVIQGWTEGIVGMKVGGRRLLVIPGDKAYGPGGRPGIEPDETLVFIVDLLEVKPAA